MNTTSVDRSPAAPRLHTAWEERTLRWARVGAALTFVVLIAFAFILRRLDVPLWVGVLIAVVGAAILYRATAARVHRRRAILGQPFPTEWAAVLQRDVVFYRALTPDEQARFRRELQVFLGEKRITGIGTELDTTTRVLAAASAVIPIFGFPEWEWDQIREVLIYPSRFTQDFRFQEGGDRHTLGMVGTGTMNGMMILSKPDLKSGFENPSDKRNVGLHEFAHLVDKSDGDVDGLPRVGLDAQAIGPWIELVRREMEQIREGDSDIDSYALTNEAEFFAVATEYFFERPETMRERHPELYAMMAKVFHQDLGSHVKALVRERKLGRPRLGRNSPCPCGSGLKYKKCCLRKAEALG